MAAHIRSRKSRQRRPCVFAGVHKPRGTNSICGWPSPHSPSTLPRTWALDSEERLRSFVAVNRADVLPSDAAQAA